MPLYPVRRRSWECSGDLSDEEEERAGAGVDISVRIVENTNDAGGMAITVQWRPKDRYSSIILPCCQTQTPQKQEQPTMSTSRRHARQKPSPPEGASHRPRKFPDTVPHLHHSFEGILSSHSDRSPPEMATSSERKNRLSLKRARLLNILGATALEDDLVLSRLVSPSVSSSRARVGEECERPLSHQNLKRQGLAQSIVHKLSSPGGILRSSLPSDLQPDADLLGYAGADDDEQAGALNRPRTLSHELEEDLDCASTSAGTSSTADSDLESSRSFDSKGMQPSVCTEISGDQESPSIQNSARDQQAAVHNPLVAISACGQGSLAADARAKLRTLLEEFAADEAVRFPKTELVSSLGEHNGSQQSFVDNSPIVRMPRLRAEEAEVEAKYPAVGLIEEEKMHKRDCNSLDTTPLAGDSTTLEQENSMTCESTTSLGVTISPGSVAARRKSKRQAATSPGALCGPPPLDMNAVNRGGRDQALAAQSEGVVIASLSPSMVHLHSELINQGAGGLPELSHSESQLRARLGVSPKAWQSLSLLSPIMAAPTSAAQKPLSVTISPLAGARLQGSTIQQTPLSQSAGAGASVSSWWTGDRPYPTSVITRRFQRLQTATALEKSSNCTILSNAHANATRSSPSQHAENREISEQASRLSPARIRRDSGDGEWKIYPGDAGSEVSGPLSPDPAVCSASKMGVLGIDEDPLSTAEVGVSELRTKAPRHDTWSVWAEVFRRGKRGAVATVQRKKERVRGNARLATHIFRVVHPDGVQYRRSPNMEDRVYTRKWWDYEQTAAGPNFGDLVNVSVLQGNWVQVAGNGLWLPIVGVKGKHHALLELVNILGAHGGVGGWNPLQSSRTAILSVDRRAVYFGAGRPAVALAEAGFDAGRHVTVVKILSMQELGYIGVTELPTDANMVNTSHLGVFGIAVGGSSHKAKEVGATRMREGTAASAVSSLGIAQDMPTKARPADAACSGSRGRDAAGQPVRLRIWIKGTLGHFVEPFRQGDEVALLLDMTARTLDYFVNRRFLGGPLHCHALLSIYEHSKLLSNEFVPWSSSPYLLRLATSTALSSSRGASVGKERHLLFSRL